MLRKPIARLAALAAVWALLAAWPAAAGVTLRVSPVANLVYQLDCVSEAVPFCGGRDEFRALWAQEFGIAAGDERIVRWRALRERYQGHIGSPTSSGAGTALVFDLGRQVRIASLAATSFDAYDAMLDVLVEPRDRIEMQRILASLRGTFDAWWTREAQAVLEAQRQAFAAALAGAPVRREMLAFERLYDLPEGAPEVVLQLVLRPRGGHHWTAQLQGHFGVAEVWGKAAANDHLPVVVHEYCHALWERMPSARIEAIRAAIVRSGALGAGQAAWLLLEESLPAALGNGRVGRALAAPEQWQRMLAEPRTLYADTDIDLAAKALLSLLDQTIAEARTLADEALWRDYVSALEARLGPRLTTPSRLLRTLAVAADSALGKDVVHRLHKIFHPGPPYSMWSSLDDCCGGRFVHQLSEHPDVPHVIIVAARHLPRASMVPAPLRARVQRALAQHRAAYAIWDDTGYPRIVVAAQDAAVLDAVYRAIIAMPALAAGVYPVQ